jgi:hypothetical protein
MLRHAFERGLIAAVTHHFGGAAQIHCYDSPPDAEINLELSVDNVHWSVSPWFSEGSIERASSEELRVGGQIRLSRELLSQHATYRGKELSLGDRLAIRAAADVHMDDTEIQTWVAFIKKYRVYRSYTYRLYDLMKFGSESTPDQWLHVNGLNAFTVLRNWFLQRQFRARYDFVLESLRHIFSGYFQDFDFQMAGQTVTLQVFTSRWGESPVQIARESTGFMMTFLSLCAVASGEPGGLIAIDEIENSLHPAAIERLLGCIRSYAREHDLSVMIATHSPVVLDQFRDTPSQILVMQPGTAPLPIRVDRLLPAEWLQQFSLGRLYTSLDFGAPRIPEAS